MDTYSFKMLNRIVFLLIALLALGTCLRVSHQKLQLRHEEDASSASKDSSVNSQQNSDDADAQAQAQKREMVEAYGRLLEFIDNSKSLKNNILNDKDPSAKEANKLRLFMVNDKYFQKQMLKKVKAKPGNEWIDNLDLGDQVRFLKIATSLTPEDAKDDTKRAAVIGQLLDDPEIGAELKKKYGDNISVEDIMNNTSDASEEGASHLLLKAKSSGPRHY